jgi:hypothetical protein
MISNAAMLWQTACVEEVGTADNETIFRTTRLGAVAESHGVGLYWFTIGANYPSEKLQHEPGKTHRANVVAFLRDWADSIEAGK